MKIKTSHAISGHRRVQHGGMHSMCGLDPRIVDFSSNTNPAPASIQTNLKRRLARIAEYPDVHCASLISGLGGYAGVPKSNLTVGNGAVEILYNFCRAFLPKKRALIAIPTFGEYAAAARLAGCKVTYFKTMNLADSLDSFISKIPKNGCVFVCNPNNPTGTILSKRQLGRIIVSANARSSLVFVDECFIELVPQSNESVIRLIKKHDNLFVLRSLTKSFGLAGIRLGYAVSSGHMASILEKIRIPWSVNSLAQDAGLLAIQNRSHLEKSKNIIKKESVFLADKISNISGFECLDSATSFILIKTRQDSTVLQKKLLKHHVLVRDCKSFEGLGDNYIRIAIKSHADNLKLVRAMEQI